MARIKLDPAHVQVQLKVSLLDSRPQIWRRLVVPADVKLPKLHAVLQLAFGWTNSHLHAFRVGDVSYEDIFPGDGGEELIGSRLVRRDEKRFRLCDLLHAPKDWLLYEYDFGDDWQHKIVVEKLSTGPRPAHAVCVTGKLATPPDDCGGIYRYYDFLAAIADPQHPEHRDMVDWIGRPFDPAAFDIDKLNQRLQQFRL